ncbi:hypothetical protein PCE1_003963 [Barthelona sp. PCE]
MSSIEDLFDSLCYRGTKPIFQGEFLKDGKPRTIVVTMSRVCVCRREGGAWVSKRQCFIGDLARIESNSTDTVILYFDKYSMSLEGEVDTLICHIRALYSHVFEGYPTTPSLLIPSDRIRAFDHVKMQGSGHMFVDKCFLYADNEEDFEMGLNIVSALKSILKSGSAGQLVLKFDEFGPINEDEISCILYALKHDAFFYRIEFEYFEFTRNSITLLADVLHCNTVLTDLYINHSRLTDGYAAILINALTGRTQLTGLELPFNALSKKGMRTICQRLLQLEIKFKKLDFSSSVPISLVDEILFLLDNSILSMVHLRLSGLKSDNMQKFHRFFQNAANIQTLVLNDCQMSIHSLQIRGCPFLNKLKRLEVNGNPMKSLDVSDLQSLIGDCTSLQYLGIAGIGLDAKDTAKILSGLSRSRASPVIKIGDPRLLPNENSLIIEMIQLSNLKGLHFESANPNFVGACMNNLRHNNTIEDVGFYDIDMTDGSVRRSAVGTMASMPQLRKVSMVSSVGGYGAALDDLLTSMSRIPLDCLCLHGSFDSGNVEALGIIKTWQMRELDLRNCSLNEEAIVALRDFVAGCEHMKHLRMSPFLLQPTNSVRRYCRDILRQTQTVSIKRHSSKPSIPKSPKKMKRTRSRRNTKMPRRALERHMQKLKSCPTYIPEEFAMKFFEMLKRSKHLFSKSHINNLKNHMLDCYSLRGEELFEKLTAMLDSIDKVQGLAGLLGNFYTNISLIHEKIEIINEEKQKKKEEEESIRFAGLDEEEIANIRKLEVIFKRMGIFQTKEMKEQREKEKMKRLSNLFLTKIRRNRLKRQMDQVDVESDLSESEPLSEVNLDELVSHFSEPHSSEPSQFRKHDSTDSVSALGPVPDSPRSSAKRMSRRPMRKSNSRRFLNVRSVAEASKLAQKTSYASGSESESSVASVSKKPPPYQLEKSYPDIKNVVWVENPLKGRNLKYKLPQAYIDKHYKYNNSLSMWQK